MRQERCTVVSADGTQIAIASEGSGPPLLLVHGGMTSSARWAPLLPFLSVRYDVSAMDRRGRGGSGDRSPYSLDREFEDVAGVACYVADRSAAPVDVLAHSFGAVCVLGAASSGAPFRRIVLYEPPGPETVPREWVHRATALVAAGEAGRAMASFLTEVIGLDVATVASLRDSPAARDSLDIVTATLEREADALGAVDLDRLARGVSQPVQLLLGERSPAWAGTIAHRLHGVLADAQLVALDGVGHEGIDTDPAQVAAVLAAFLRG